MPHMPKHLGVGPIIKTFEERYADPAVARESLRKLREKDTAGGWKHQLSEIGSLAAVGAVTNYQLATPATTPNPQVRQHLNEDWFGSADHLDPNKQTTGWWNFWKGNPEQTMREAMTRALEISLRLKRTDAVPAEPTSFIQKVVAWVRERLFGGPRPIRFFWICGLPRFESYVSWDQKSVTVIILTPGWYQGLDHDFDPDPAGALDQWVHSTSAGMIFVGQNVDESAGTIVQMEPDLVVHRMDIKRDGRGDWP